MNDKIKLNAAALLCAMMVTTAGAYSQEITDFNSLKQAVNDAHTGKHTDIEFANKGADVEFGKNESLNVQDKKNITVNGKGNVFEGNNANGGPGFHVYSGGSLTLKDVTMQNFEYKSNYPFAGAVINSGGKVTLTSEEGKDITFKNNTCEGTPRDLRQLSGSTIINGDSGSVNFNTGISGGGTVTHNGEGNLNLNGDNSNFYGTFNNEKGNVTLGESAKFFAGTSNITGGTLNWKSNQDIGNGTLKFGNEPAKGGSLVVGDDSNTASKLTIKRNSSLSGAKDITVKEGATLDIQNQNTIYGTMQGAGTVNLGAKPTDESSSGASLTFKNSASFSGLKFTSNNGLVIFDSAVNVDSILQTMLKETSGITNLTLNFNNNTVTEDLTAGESTISEINFTGNNSWSGNLSVEASGTVNVSDGTLTLNEGTGITNNTGTVTIAKTGALAGNAQISNKGQGTFNLEGDASAYTGEYVQSESTSNLTTNVGKEAKFFGGKSTFKSGTLNWNSKNDVSNGTNIQMAEEGTALNVGKQSAEAKLTIKGDSNIEKADINLYDGTLSVQKDMSYNKKINGDSSAKVVGGTLDVTNATLTLNKGADFDTNIKFSSNNATLKLNGIDNTLNATTILNAVAANSAENNKSLNLNLTDVSAASTNLEINGTNISSLTFDNTSSGETTYLGNITTSNGGEITVNQNANVELEGELTHNSTSFTNKGKLTVDIVKGTGSIQNGKDLIVNGDASQFTGTYRQDFGGTSTVTADGTFFEGSSILSGTLNWNTNNDVQKADLDLSSLSNLNVGDGSHDAQLTIKDGSKLNKDNGKIQINEKGKLNLSKSFNGSDAFTGLQVTGNGTLGIQNSEVTFEGTQNSLAETLKLQTKDSTLTFNNTGNTLPDHILTAIQDGSSTQEGLTLNFNNANTSSGKSLTVDGSKIKAANLNGSNFGADLTTSGTGVVTATGANNVSGTVANGGNMDIKNGTFTYSGSSFTNSANATVSNNATFDYTGSGTMSNSGTFTNEGSFTFNGSSFSNGGSVTNSGDFTLNGEMSGSGTFSNSSNVIVNADVSGMSGNYTQTAGKTTVNASGKLFGGTKEIQSGILEVTGDNLYYTNVQLGSGATLNHTSTGSTGSTIDSNVLTYTGTGANANFSGASETYTLADKFSGSGNNLTFKDTNLKLGGTDYLNAGAITLDGTTLNVHEEGCELKEYKFKDFTSNNGKLDFDVQIKKGTDDDKTAYLDTDRFTFEGKSKGKLSVGKIYIQNEDNAENGMDIETKQDVLSGGKVTFENSSKLDDDKVDFTKATSAFTYDVQVSDKTVALKRTGNTDDDTLYKMDEREGTRQFSFKEKYQSDKSLDNTENGTLLVYGETKGERSDVLSGKLSGKETEKGSFFNIGSDVTTHLELSDMTISDADSSSIGGSVLHNDSETSKVVIQNVDIKDNSASAGNGGAIYNNGGDESQSQPGSSDFKGLFVNDVHFSNNKASDKGGALYNDTNGYTILQNVEVDAATGDAKNDIYNGGYMEVTNGGKVNKFNSDIENAGTLNFYSVRVGDEDGSNITSLNNTSSGTVTFGGYNTIVDLTNEGTVNFGSDGEYTIPTENNLTGTFTNSKTAVNNSVLNVSGEKAKLENKTGGTFTNKDELYIEENAQLNNEADIQNEGMISVDAGSVVKGSENGTITNKGGFDLEGDASEYKGKYTQSNNDDSITQVDKGAKFFNGDTSITAGTLNWFTENDLSDDAKLTVSGDNTRLVVGTGVDNSNLTLKNGSSVDSKVTLFEGSTINIGQESSSSESSLKIKDDSYWGGTINVDENGSLVISSNTPTQGEKSVLNAKKGSVNIEKGSLYLANGSSIAGDVKTTIGDNTTLYIDENAEVTLNEGDKTKGHTLLNGGTLNYEKGVTTDGENVTLEAHTGKLSVQNGGQLQLNAEKSIVDGDVDITITSDSSVDINGGTLQIDDEDTWEGAITLDDGTLNYHAKKSGTFHANKGNLNLLKDSVLTIVDPSVVKDEVVIDIQKGSTVDIENGKFHLDESDKWNGLIKNNNGELTVSGIDNTKGHAGGLQQNGGKSEFTDNTNIMITDKNSYIDGGDVTISENSNLTFGKGSKKLNVDSLTMTNDSTLGVKNHVIHDINVGDMTVEGKNNVTVDLNPRKHKNDKFIIDELTSAGGGSLNVSEFSFSGGAPIDKKIKFQIFDAENVSDNITFTSSITKIKSPIGNYGLKSLGDGIYEASFKSFNPQVYRGQVSTLAAYTHQLMVDDMITNHFVLHNDNFMNNAKNSNKYAAGGALFAPYQNTYEDGGLWAKTYVSLNKMDLTHNLRVGNNIWGTLAGADLPAVELNKDWKFIPTGYIGYNAGHQHFNGVSMQQNGGQLGVMGTFIKDNDFITSVTAYGGGYTNDMDVAGYQDDTGNWFAGTAVKTAYNFHPFRDFIFQPNLFAAYNAFGKQNWGTDFGIMSMSSNMLNGVNVAPGANFIYNKKTWSLYATLQYMYFINDKIGGQAGNIGLPNVRMDHGYIQYGIGGTKTWSDRLGAYGQVTMRNAGVTGIGFQFGINYLFDIMPKKRINAYNQEIPSTYIKKVYKPLDNLTSANKPVS